MSDILKLSYKVGQIEFEAEGATEIVENQIVNFINMVLPAAVDAMVKTQSIIKDKPDVASTVPMLCNEETNTCEQNNNQEKTDFARTSLPSFIKPYGDLNEQDFTLFAAYFYEKKYNKKIFSIEDVKKYYNDARRPVPTNPSMSLYSLTQKGLIMYSEEGESGKNYMISEDGLEYINNYVPKETKGDKKKNRTNQKKSSSSISNYTGLTADDLNLKKYPSIKSLSGARNQVIMAMYIVTNENKGEWFTVDDIIFLLTNIFELPSDTNMINGVFKRNKSMFNSEADPKNKKALRRRLLSGAKDLAKELINQKNDISLH